MVRWGTVSSKVAQELGTFSAKRLLAWSDCAWCRWISQEGRARFCPHHMEGAMGEARGEASGTRRWLVRRVPVGDGHKVEVLEVRGGDKASAEYVTPARSQRAFNHSPDGFEFGYGGSGPAQLALAILLRFFNGDEERAVALHNGFLWSFLVDKHCEEFELTEGDIAAWVPRVVGGKEGGV